MWVWIDNLLDGIDGDGFAVGCASALVIIFLILIALAFFVGVLAAAWWVIFLMIFVVLVGSGIVENHFYSDTAAIVWGWICGIGSMTGFYYALKMSRVLDSAESGFIKVCAVIVCIAISAGFGYAAAHLANT